MGRGERKKNLWSLELARSFQKSSNIFLLDFLRVSKFIFCGIFSFCPAYPMTNFLTNSFLCNCKIVLWFLHFKQCKKTPALQIFVLALYHDYQLTFACTYDWKNILLLRKTIQQLLPSSLSCVQMSILVKKSNPKYNTRTKIYSVIKLIQNVECEPNLLWRWSSKNASIAKISWNCNPKWIFLHMQLFC